MDTLVIGSGLVGTQVVRELVESGERPRVLDYHPQPQVMSQIIDPHAYDLITGDVLNYESLEELVRKNGIKRVIHTAANPMLTVGATERPHEAIKLNIMGTANVLEACRKNDVERLVFTSSSVLYTYVRGGGELGELSEDNFPRTTTIYGSTKLACENLGLNYVESYGLDFVAVRFAAVFGPWSGSGGGGPSTMFNKLVRTSLAGSESTLSPRVIEYVYSKDAARGTVLASLARNPSGRIYNVSMGKIYTPEEIGRLITQRIPNAKIRIQAMDIGTPATTSVSPISLDRSRAEIGYVPAFDMPAALDDFVTFCRQNS